MFIATPTMRRGTPLFVAEYLGEPQDLANRSVTAKHSVFGALGDVPARSAHRERLHRAAIVGMDAFDEALERRLPVGFAPEDPIELVGPRDLSGLHVPRPAPDVGDLFGFAQKLFALEQDLSTPEICRRALLRHSRDLSTSGGVAYYIP